MTPGRATDEGSGTRWQQFAARYVLSAPDERQQAGYLWSLLLALGSVIVLIFPLLPGGNTHHLWLRVPVAAFGLLWGLICRFVLNWRRGSLILTNGTFIVGLAGAAVMIWATGTGDTTGPLFLIWMSMVSAYFYRPATAAVYLLIILAVQALPLLYETHEALHQRVVVELIVAAAGDVSVGIAIVAAKHRLERLRQRAETDALTDSLTGAANHRVLDIRLRAAIASSAASGSLLAVAVLDIDHFKQVNDSGGHDFGDATLVAVTRCLRGAAAPGDIVARSGGDEFTWVMPETNAEEALIRAEAAREAVERLANRGVSISVGISDSSRTLDPGELVRLADGALYWSKAHGRNRCQVYDPAVVDVFSAEERADRLARSQALLGLRALARAIDAKDPATRAHSERVSRMAGQLATAAGWDEPRAGLLAEAALVHDVGKIAVDDHILHKRGSLTSSEREDVNAHAEMSAKIVEGVLSDEQVEWIRTHHERADGSGYPRGLSAREIPPGGALLSIADAFDVMTAGRTYSHRKMVADALEECRAQVGLQFTPAAVAALERLLDPASVGADADAVFAI